MRKPVGTALAFSALVILWIGNATDLDLRLAAWMFDSSLGDFPWRHRWFAEVFCHTILKIVCSVVGIAVVGLALGDLIRPFRRLDSLGRARLRLIACAAVLIPLTVSLLKMISSSHCPWDLSGFGGTEAYVRLLQPAVFGAHGRCMPAGHASSAMWMVAFSVCWLPGRPRTALVAGCCLLAFGFALGWVQQLRGAHFLTHTLWTMWIACAIVALLYHRLMRRRQADALTWPQAELTVQ